MKPTTINMKKVACQSTSCPSRRVHYERPDVPRGVQEFWVHEDTIGPFFCSLECAMYAAAELDAINKGVGDESKPSGTSSDEAPGVLRSSTDE